MYTNVESLDRKKHADWRLRGPDDSVSFAANLHTVPLLSVEFAETARCYPILFAEDKDKVVQPIALLGLKQDHNLFIKDNKWDPDFYVPAFIRRYPFITNQQGLVAVDSDYGKGSGEPFFNDKEENTEALDKTIEFLTQFQAEIGRTRNLVEKLALNKLLVDWNITAVTPSGDGYKFEGLKIVNEQALMALDKDQVFSLFPTAELFWIHAHLVSLGNVARLLQRMPQAPATKDHATSTAMPKSKMN
ncbi:MAG: SapC family protein [Candidatus Symbiobacter sp.]|nr:SapC family protein [Candidatus Symbiobacter sp.]